MIQRRVRTFLERMIKQKRVPVSLLFYGKEGVGKGNVAFEFAKALLCLNNLYPPCGNCSSCSHMDAFKKEPEENLAYYGEDKRGRKVFMYLQGEHPDFIYVKPDRSEIKIDQIRGVKEFVYLRPALSRKKVVLIEPADSMNPFSQNALLKVLEEPPEDTHFVLVSHNIDKVLPTIRSRSFLLEFPPLSLEEIKSLTGIDDPFILEFSGGSVNMALKLYEDREILEVALDILSGDILRLYRRSFEIEKWDYDRQALLLRLLEILLHRRVIEGKEEHRQALDRVVWGMEFLNRGIRLSILIFYVGLIGGEKDVLHKG